MEKFVEREIENDLINYLKVKEIIALVGTRQCGKTTLINHILDIQEKKKLKISRISFDNIKDLLLFEEDIDSFIEKYVKEFDILFIDEVHYSKDSGKKLKYIYDNFKIKIIISGSSAVEISIHSLKYLVGRIFTFTLYPFSFGEFLRYKDKSLFRIYKLGKYKGEIIQQLNKYLEEFIMYGGYPRVVLSQNKYEKEKVLEGIYNTYLLKEIREILDLSDDIKLINLVKVLSLQTGNIINYNELSQITGFSFIELKKYLNILEKTYICNFVKPFYTNKRVELVKNPKVYYIDLGFRNICIDNFSKERTDKGSIYENFVLSELIKSNIQPKFWNTKSQAEVDFILEKQKKIIPIEIKSFVKESKITKSFDSFIEKYKPRKAYYLSLDYEGVKKFKGCSVNFLSFVKYTGLLNKRNYDI